MIVDNNQTAASLPFLLLPRIILIILLIIKAFPRMPWPIVHILLPSRPSSHLHDSLGLCTPALPWSLLFFLLYPSLHIQTIASLSSKSQILPFPWRLFLALSSNNLLCFCIVSGVYYELDLRVYWLVSHSLVRLQTPWQQRWSVEFTVMCPALR